MKGGLLQLPARTLLVVDETHLREGKLLEQGTPLSFRVVLLFPFLSPTPDPHRNPNLGLTNPRHA